MADEVTMNDTPPPGADTPSAASVEYIPSAQKHELQNIEFFDWFSNKTIPTLMQAVAVVAVVAASFASGAVIALAGAAMLAFELGRAHIQNKADLNRELALYHKDIARVLGKPANAELTIDDMRKAADEKIVGDKALKPLRMELEHLAYRGKYNMLMGATRALVTTVAALIMHSTLPPIKSLASIGSIAMPLSGALGMVGMATMGIEKLGKSYFDQHKPISIYTELAHMEEMVRHQPLKPEQIFPIIVKLDKELAKDVRDRFGKPYAELTHHNKELAIATFEDKAHTQALTQGINEGKLSVTAISLTAFRQREWNNPDTFPSQPSENPGRSALVMARKQERTATEQSFLVELTRDRTPTQAVPER